MVLAETIEKFLPLVSSYIHVDFNVFFSEECDEDTQARKPPSPSWREWRACFPVIKLSSTSGALHDDSVPKRAVY